jgi:hypothetical protein
MSGQANDLVIETERRTTLFGAKKREEDRGDVGGRSVTMGDGQRPPRM